MKLIGCFSQVHGFDNGFKISSILERIVLSHELGIAIFLTESGLYSVSYIREDSVASAYSSLQVSDVVLAIDGVSLRGQHVDAVRKMLEGKPETPVMLEIRRAGLEDMEKTDSVVLLRPSVEKVNVLFLLDLYRLMVEKQLMLSDDSNLRSMLQQESFGWSISQVQEWTGVINQTYALSLPPRSPVRFAAACHYAVSLCIFLCIHVGERHKKLRSALPMMPMAIALLACSGSQRRRQLLPAAHLPTPTFSKCSSFNNFTTSLSDIKFSVPGNHGGRGILDGIGEAMGSCVRSGTIPCEITSRRQTVDPILGQDTIL
eukprot:763930-Hanusia_phi.AAC.2